MRRYLVVAFLVMAVLFVGYRSEAKAASTYVSTAKGWKFNDIVYIDSCPRYGSASGGYSPGNITPGYYRFVKSNGSYVALCEVNLETGTKARAAFKSTWDSKGGMWKWEQALYNQIDGTPEGSRATATKAVTAPNGKTVSDQAQNYRFIKCWIKIEDLKQNPATIATYSQTVRYFYTDERTGTVVEDTAKKTVVKVQKGKTYYVTPQTLSGYTLTSLKLNGVAKPTGALSYTVNGNNEVCIYYRKNKLIFSFFACGGQGKMDDVIFYYGESVILPQNEFVLVDGCFKGWAKTPGAGISYQDGATVSVNLSNADQAVNLYAVWDYGPSIELSDLFFTKAELENASNVEEYVLSFYKIIDKEDGQLSYENITITEDLGKLLGMQAEGWMSYSVNAVDSAGNKTTGNARLCIVDTQGKKRGVDAKDFRFVSKEYLNTIKARSIWFDGENRTYLEDALEKEPIETWKMTEFGWKRE